MDTQNKSLFKQQVETLQSSPPTSWIECVIYLTCIYFKTDQMVSDYTHILHEAFPSREIIMLPYNKAQVMSAILDGFPQDLRVVVLSAHVLKGRRNLCETETKLRDEANKIWKKANQMFFRLVKNLYGDSSVLNQSLVRVDDMEELADAVERLAVEVENEKALASAKNMPATPSAPAATEEKEEEEEDEDEDLLEQEDEDEEGIHRAERYEDEEGIHRAERRTTSIEETSRAFQNETLQVKGELISLLENWPTSPSEEYVSKYRETIIKHMRLVLNREVQSLGRLGRILNETDVIAFFKCGI
jgi:hypothetical protein